MRDIVTSQILAGPVKINEHKQDEHGDIEKKLEIFHILNGVLAKTRNIIFYKRFPDHIADSWVMANGLSEKHFAASIPRANQDFQLISREKRRRLGML